MKRFPPLRQTKCSHKKEVVAAEGFIALTSPGETPHMKWKGMLVVSLTGVNFGFWYHFGCSGQNAIIFSSEGLF